MWKYTQKKILKYVKREAQKKKNNLEKGTKKNTNNNIEKILYIKLTKQVLIK